MLLPWFRNKNFELRINTIFSVEDDREEFIIEIRKPSIIPFIKWKDWDRITFPPMPSFDKALDKLNKLKISLIEKDKHSKRADEYNKKKKTWEKIDV